MIVLGWHGGIGADDGWIGHDGAAVIVRDGKVIAAIEEERLDRIKHSNSFPALAIRACLTQAGIEFDEIDLIATDWDEGRLDIGVAHSVLANPSRPHLNGKSWLASLFQQEFQRDVSNKLRFCRHHMAHVQAAWHASGLPDVLTVCLDGGDFEGFSGLIAYCSGENIKVIGRLRQDQSLGQFYEWGTRFLGYQRFDEYKVMGLAPYGDPQRYASLFDKIVELSPGGQFSLLSYALRTQLVIEEGIFQRFRRKGEPFEQCHKDFAAGLQRTLERIVLHLIAHFKKVTSARSLCLTGGVAHNCTLNGLIYRSNLFEQMYVQAAAHDAGNAMGAALSVEPQPPAKAIAFPHLYLGVDVGSSREIGERLARWSGMVKTCRVNDVHMEAAKMLASGLVLGWVQGRAEFGPRALGNRSILADPRPAENKKLINAMIKKRESYRPFAPSVLEEHLPEYFEMSATKARFPFMNITLPVKLDKRELLGAVTHVDGSARVQAVEQSTNPAFHGLITAFYTLTGIPILLNTSFNNNFEPIVNSLDDAVVCFLTTGLHRLVIDNWVVEKRDSAALADGLSALVPTVVPTCRLVRDAPGRSSPHYTIVSVANRFFAQESLQITEMMWLMLARSSKDMTFGDHCRHYGLSSRDVGNLRAELFALWEQRAVSLLPLQSD